MGESPETTATGVPTAIEISDDVPDIQMFDVSTAALISLRSVVKGGKPLMFWFWSPFSETCQEEAPAVEHFARSNSHRLTVVGIGGIGTLEHAQQFVAAKGTTFTVLWSNSRDAWEHYDMNSTSDFLLLDRFGNRPAGKTVPFDEALVEKLLEELL